MNWTPKSWRPELRSEIGRMMDMRIDEVLQPTWPSRFAIRIGGNCLAKNGEWELEPQPSSRDDEFFGRCRFDTLEEAMACAEKHLDRRVQEFPNCSGDVSSPDGGHRPPLQMKHKL